MRKNVTPGVGIAFINNFEIVWTACYGYKYSREPVTTDTLFEAGSATKAVTAVTVLQYVDKGVVSLDDSVNDFLIQWKIPDTKKGDNVTLRHLLTHTAWNSLMVS